MAATEARSARQHTANCCFVQEDVRRAPKFSGCQSSSSSKLESDGAPGNAANGPDHSTPVYMPLNHSSDLPPDMRWWLHLQPSFENQKDNMCEQLNPLEAELEGLSAGSVHKSAKLSQGHQPIDKSSAHIKYNDHSFVGQPWKVSATCMKIDQDVGMQELKAVLSDDIEKTPEKDMGEFWYPDDRLLELEFHCLVGEQPKKLSSDFDSHWVRAEKTEPWWRTTGKDELASLVAQKSREHIENCDLPRPQTKHFRKGSFAHWKGTDHGEILASSLDWMGEMGLSSLANYAGGSPDYICADKKQCMLGNVSLSLNDSDRLFSGNNDTDTANEDQGETENIFENDPSKAQLLEALCHSQTRAREAEKAAQQAYTEKEHIITLFFRQASQLFAYKQWLQLLQLENFCLQLKNKNQPNSTLFSAVLPWDPHKGRQRKEGRQKAGKRKRSSPRYVISKCAVAFAMGLSLAGAGLLLGWTMGWLFPTP